MVVLKRYLYRKEIKGGITMFKVSEVKVRFVDGDDKGIICWASCVVNDALFLNNIAVRNARSGEIVLSFPANISRGSKRYFHFNPISKSASAVLKTAILKKLRLNCENVTDGC